MQKAASVAGAASGAGGELAGASNPWIAALMNMTPMTSRMYGAYKGAQAGNMGLQDQASTRSLLAGLLDPSGGSADTTPLPTAPAGPQSLMGQQQQSPSLRNGIASALSGDSSVGGFNSFDPTSEDMGPGLSKMPGPPSTLPAEIQAAPPQQPQPRQMDTRTLLQTVLGLASTGGMSPKEAMDMGLRSTGNTEAIAGRSGEARYRRCPLRRERPGDQRQAAARGTLEQIRHNQALRKTLTSSDRSTATRPCQPTPSPTRGKSWSRPRLRSSTHRRRLSRRRAKPTLETWQA